MKEITIEGKNKKPVTQTQIKKMLMIELFSTTSLILPALVVRLCQKNGLASLLFGSGLAFLLALYYLWICDSWESGLEKQVPYSVGTVGQIFYGTVYGIRYFLHGLFLMIVFCAVLKEVLLPEQSTGLILIPMLLLVYYGTRKQMAVRARILEFLFLYIFVPLLLVLFLALFQVQYDSLPSMILAGGGDLLQGGYGILILYSAMEFILFLVPVTEWKEKKSRGMVLGQICLLVTALNIFIYVITVGMFGTVRTGKKLWSALSIMQSVRLPGHFLERLDILFLVFWIFSVFALFSGYLYYSELIVENCIIFKKRKGKKDPIAFFYPFVYLAGIFMLTIWQPDPEKVLPWFAIFFMGIDFPLAVILPCYIRIKQRKKWKRQWKKGGVFFLILSCLFLTGCESREDLEDKNYAIAIAVDKGENKTFHFTYEVANLNQSVTEGGDTINGKLLTYEADSLKEAEQMQKRSSEKKLTYGHLKAILFSKEVFIDETVRKKIKEELEEKSNLAGTVLLFETEGDAKSYLELEKQLGKPVGQYLDEMVSNHKEEKSSQYTLGEYLRDEEEGSPCPMPVLTRTEKRIWLQ